MLKELGVFEECCVHGFQTAWFKTFDKQGNLLFKVSESFLDDKLPGRNNILRKTLNDILIKHAEASGARILWGKKIVAYEETPEAVTAIFDDGEKMQADILAGFDGIHSIVRDAMLQKEIEKEFLGMGAWRFYIELPDYTFEDATLMYRSGETQIGVVPLAEHAGYVFVLQPCASDYWDEEETRFDRVKEILSGFPGLNFVTKHMSKEHPVIFNKLEQVAVQDPWYKGRVVIGETPPMPERRPSHKERQWPSRMPWSSPKNSKTTTASKPHFMHTTKEERQERSKCRTYLQKSSAAG